CNDDCLDYDLNLSPATLCFSAFWDNYGIGLHLKSCRSSKTGAQCASNEVDIGKLFQALGRRKLSHQSVAAIFVIMLKTLHGFTPK
ncbi:unnamed protein product, partial [Pocillopora meandrina]